MANFKKVAILGGGNGAHAMAADLTLKGYTVNICEAHQFVENFKITLDRQAIQLIDAWGKSQLVKVNKATADFEEAINGCEYIMLTVPAIGTENMFRSVMPYLEDGQVVLKWSSNFSTLCLAKMLRDNQVKKNITLAETHTLPWGCRFTSPGTIEIMVWVAKLLIATFPAKNIVKVQADVSKMYPVVSVENVLATSLNNLNPVVHPIGTIMNTGWIESAGQNFHLYRDGNTYSVSKGIKKVFEEVSAVAQAVGVTMNKYPEEDFWNKSAIMSTYARAVFDKEGMVAKISGPSSLQSRYITEDLPFGLVPIARLARKFGVQTPVIDSVIVLASMVNDTDYLATGLTLEELGIANFKNKEDLNKALYDGF